MYDLDGLRFVQFVSRSSNDFRELPLSKDALSRHVIRSAYTAGWVWGNALSEDPLILVEDYV